MKSLIIDKNNKKQNLKGTTNQEKSLQNSDLSELKKTLEKLSKEYLKGKTDTHQIQIYH